MLMFFCGISRPSLFPRNTLGHVATPAHPCTFLGSARPATHDRESID